MARFKYLSRDAAGMKFTGNIEAPNQSAAAAQLSRAGQWPISIQNAGQKIIVRDLLGRKQKVRLEDLIFYLRQLGVLFASGIPLNVALLMLSESSGNQTLSQMSSQMHHDIEGGASLTEALSRHPKIFPDIYAAIIEAGEASGTLEQSLERVAVLSERKFEARQRMRALFTYPAVVVSVVSLVLVFLIMVVFPMFAKLFSQANVALPLPTVIIIKFSEIIRSYWYIVAAAGGLAWLALDRYLKTPAGKFRFDQFKLQIPVYGSVLLKMEVSGFAQIFYHLNNSGLPVIASLALIARTAGNQVMARALKIARASIESGATISQALAGTGIFPAMVAELIATGEETGKLDLIMGKISSFYDREVDYTLKKIPVILEPVILVVLGAMIALIYLSLLLPMIDMIKVVRH